MIRYVQVLDHGALTPQERSLHNRWRSMIERCYTPTNCNYKWYGARGIKVCRRWLRKFSNYASDVGLPPGPDYDLGRIDNDGNYEPKNVRWETKRTNLTNYRRNVRVTINGVTKLASEWADQAGVSRATFTFRMQNGWKPEELILPPGSRLEETTINGVTKSDVAWAKEIGISYFGFRKRKAMGDTGDELLRVPHKGPRKRLLASDSPYVVPAPHPA